MTKKIRKYFLLAKKERNIIGKTQKYFSESKKNYFLITNIQITLLMVKIQKNTFGGKNSKNTFDRCESKINFYLFKSFSIKNLFSKKHFV